MCIVCEIKSALEGSKATAEEKAAVMAKVETLARNMGDVIDVVEAAHGRKPDVFKPEELATIAKAEELFTTANPLAALLGALFGGVTVEHVVVIPQPGESVDEAVARTMAERQAQPDSKTKH